MIIKTNIEALQKARVKAGYSIRELSRVSGVMHSTLIHIEHRKVNPSPAVTKKLCDTLGVDFDYLFEIKEGE